MPRSDDPAGLGRWLPGRRAAASTDAFGMPSSRGSTSLPAAAEALDADLEDDDIDEWLPEDEAWVILDRAPMYRVVPAALVDFAIGFALIAAVWSVTSFPTPGTNFAGIVNLATFAAVVVIALGYGPVTMGGGRAQTPGLRLFGLKLVRHDGEPVTTGYVLARDGAFLGRMPGLHWLCLVLTLVVPPLRRLDERTVGTSTVVDAS